MNKRNYIKFILMLFVSFCIMYAVMFLNVDSIDHIYLSLTRMYMSLMMVTPMAVLMMFLMGKMYTNRKLNAIIIFSGIVVFSVSLYLLRTQAFISDVQYMQAMIPHHSSALLTSKNAGIRDPEVRKLSEGIIESQEKEIREMKIIIERLKK